MTAPDTCAAASQHLADCFGQEAGALPSSCDPGEAERILGADCAALNASLGKADAWWCNPWTPFWVAGCGGGSDSTPASDGRVTGRVDFTYDNIGFSESSVSCALVVLTDAQGDEVARTHSATSGGFAFDGLGEGQYTVTVYDRFGTAAENVPALVNGEPATRTVAVRGNEDTRVDFLLALRADGSDPDFGDGELSDTVVGRCVTVQHTFEVADACGNLLAPYYDVRRDWVITLTDEAGEVRYSTPLCQPANGDHWSWDGCKGTDDDVILNAFSQVLPGAYTLAFIRVDLPDQNNLDYERELRWNQTAAHPETLRFEVEPVPADKVITLTTDEPFTVVDPWLGCE